MLFGNHIEPADAVAPSHWIEQRCHGDEGTAGALVPNHYDSVLRVHPPAPAGGDWWTSYRELHEVVTSTGARHTSTPERAFFAVWEGHGFDTGSSHVAWLDPPTDDVERRSRDAERARVRLEGQRRNAAIRAALAQIPTFERPQRTYYLLKGPVVAVADLRYPDCGDWRNPDLFWPEDRRWFVATDVDFWSLYIGGANDFIAELAQSVPTQPAVVRAGLPNGTRFHDLRHTYAAFLIAEGAHPRAIMERMGHSTINVTLGTYGHLFPAIDAQLDAALGDRWNKARPTKDAEVSTFPNLNRGSSHGR